MHCLQIKRSEEIQTSSKIIQDDDFSFTPEKCTQYLCIPENIGHVSRPGLETGHCLAEPCIPNAQNHP